MLLFGTQYSKSVKTPNGNKWALIHTPEGAEKFPVIVFIHGAGEIGKTENDLRALTLYGTPHLINNGDPFEFSGIKFGSLAIQQQFATYTTLKEILYVLDNDESFKGKISGIFITGISLGAQSIFESIFKEDVSILKRVSAFACFSGSWYSSLDHLLNNIVANKTPILVYGGTKEDKYVQYGLTAIPAKLNANGIESATAKEDAGHCCWNVPYSPNYKFSNGKSIYDAFAQYVPNVTLLPTVVNRFTVNTQSGIVLQWCNTYEEAEAEIKRLITGGSQERYRIDKIYLSEHSK